MRAVNHWSKLFKKEVELSLSWHSFLRTGSFPEMLAQQLTGPSPMETGGSWEIQELRKKLLSGFNSSAEHSSLSQWKVSRKPRDYQ